MPVSFDVTFHRRLPMLIALFFLSFSNSGLAADNKEKDSLRDQLFKIYQRSHAVKINQDKAGYESVYSRSRMEQFKKIMQDLHLTSFEEYMQRVATTEKQSFKGSALAPQSAQASDNNAVLKILAPKACGEAGKQDCLVTVDFVKEGGMWKIDHELISGQP